MECILTTMCRDRKGYGWKRHEGKMHRHHRVAYALAHGLSMQDIEGVVIRHTCDNPPCINPDHLLSGTHADNAQDKVERGRVPCYKGERNNNCKLSDVEVEEIKRLYATGNYTQKEIGYMYGINRGTVSRLCSGARRASTN